MDAPILGDKSQFPTDAVVFSHIGESKTLWAALFEYLAREHPDFTRDWRYYNDGKSWLMKVQHKKKPVFWLSVVKGTFRTSFYLHENTKQKVEASALPEELKNQFRDGKSFGKLRGITVVYRNKRDLKAAKELIGMKLAA